MNGFNQRDRRSVARESAIRLRAAQRIEAVLRHGARVGRSPTTCSNRSSTRASSRISTSSPRRRSRASIYRRALGLRRRRGRRRLDDHRAAQLNGPSDPPCFDYQTLGDELDKARPLLALLCEHVRQPFERRRRRVVELSGGQAHRSRARLEERRHLAELEVHHRRARRQARELHVDHAGLRRLRSRELRRRLRSVVGCRARQYRRQEQVLELDGDLRAVGRLGRPLRPRPAAVSRITMV